MASITEEFRAIRDRLRLLPDRLQTNVVNGAARAGAVAIQKEARLNVPVDSGNLKKNIAVKKASRRNTERGHTKYHVYIRPKAFYGMFVEFGTSKQVAQPFMRPAFENSAEKAVQAFQAYAIRRTDREIERLGR